MKNLLTIILIFFCISGISQDLPKIYYEPYVELSQRGFGSVLLSWEPNVINKNSQGGNYVKPASSDQLTLTNYSFQLSQAFHFSTKDPNYIRFTGWANSKSVGTVKQNESFSLSELPGMSFENLISLKNLNNFLDYGAEIGAGGFWNLSLGAGYTNFNYVSNPIDSLTNVNFKSPLMVNLKVALSVPPFPSSANKRRFCVDMYCRLKYTNKLQTEFNNIIKPEGSLFGLNAGFVLNFYSKQKNLAGLAFTMGLVFDEYLIWYPAGKGYWNYYDQELTNLAFKFGLGFSW